MPGEGSWRRVHYLAAYRIVANKWLETDGYFGVTALAGASAAPLMPVVM